MASYKGHLVGGVVAGAVFTLVVSFAPVVQFAEYANLLHGWQPLAAVFIVSMLFSLFPDVDTNSKAQDIFYWAVFLLDALLIWAGNIHAAAYLGIVAMLPILAHHRGWTHARWAPFVVPLPIIIVPWLYNETMVAYATVLYIAAVLGYLSHLFLDGLLNIRGRRRR